MRWICCWLFVGCLAPTTALFAHQLDEYLQSTLVAIEPDRIELNINLTPGVEVAEQVLGLIDSDRDEVITMSEAAGYADRLKRDLAVRIDQRPCNLACLDIQIPPPVELRSGSGIIQATFTAALPRPVPGTHTLTIENDHLPGISAYLVNASKPRPDVVRITRQIRNQTQSVAEIVFATSPAGGSSVVAAITGLVIAFVLASLGIRRSSIHQRKRGDQSSKTVAASSRGDKI